MTLLPSLGAVPVDSHCARGSSLPALSPVLEHEGRWVRRASSAQALAAVFGLQHFLLKMQEFDFTLFFMVPVCSRKFHLVSPTTQT